mgnify:CR=1 FL=1
MNANVWLVMIIGGALTFAMRLSFIYLFGRFEFPPLVRRALRYVPAAVLSAIVLPAMFLPDGALDLSLGNYRLQAGLVAILVAWRTRNTLFTILSGMAALLLAMWAGGLI